MRRFHSYGPVDCEEHFCVPRNELIQQCFTQLIDHPDKGGHFFTIWAPRQTGKTWLMRQVREEILRTHGDRFVIGMMSVQGVVMNPDDPAEAVLKRLPLLFWETFKRDMKEPPADFDGFKNLFLKDRGFFDKPLVLFIDEFDSLPAAVIDRLVTLFRDMYLKRESFLLHGLALIGVRAVLGVESLRGSPFNIQRSLHVPNFTPEEVTELFRQYQEESGEVVEPTVVEAVYDVTRGQPGLVGWFGELLAEKYHPGPGKVIGRDRWEYVLEAALRLEWNNTLLNLVKKVRAGYQQYVLELFAHPDTPFSLDADWCAYLYLNGVIDAEIRTDDSGKRNVVCRFASPFVQERLYNALTYDLVGDRLPILALEPLDDLSDVFSGPEPDVPALLERYKAFLVRLKAKGLNPWKDQPRRVDLHLTEAVGHFHLYSWLQQALGRWCVVAPEFPTGNGRVDIWLKCDGKQAILEIKSFVDRKELDHSRSQAGAYARKLGLSAVTLAVFVPTDDNHVLTTLSTREPMDGVMVTTVAIGWV